MQPDMTPHHLQRGVTSKNCNLSHWRGSALGSPKGRAKGASLRKNDTDKYNFYV